MGFPTPLLLGGIPRKQHLEDCFQHELLYGKTLSEALRFPSG